MIEVKEVVDSIEQRRNIRCSVEVTSSLTRLQDNARGRVSKANE